MKEERNETDARADQIPPQSSAGKSRLRQAIELISTLISLSHSIKVFAVKWQLIRKKLDELLSGLAAVENGCSGGENPSHLLSKTVLETTDTLNECSDLARRCIDLSYGGKLLMQSDLDIVCAKLDAHVKSLSEIYANGLLTQCYALVVSRPGLGASREDMRFYMEDLLSRLKIGGLDMKKQALTAFNEVIQEDKKYIKIAVEVDGLISVVVNFLDSKESEIQEEAIKGVLVIAGCKNYRGELVGAGVIARLMQVLEGGTKLSRELAARCLQILTENSDNAWSVSAHGGVTVLLKICTGDDCGEELVGLACGVLKNLSGVEAIKRFMVEEGAISVFIKLARSRDEVLQISSIDCLRTMAYGNESIKELVVREGGIRALVRLLDPKYAVSSKAKEMAFKGIATLCSSSVSDLNALISYGYMDHVLFYLRNGEVTVQEMALKAAVWLCATSDEAKKAMGDAGFMPELVKFLDSKSIEIREMAAEVLSSMVSVPRNQKKFVQNDHNVGFLLQLLDPESANLGNRKLLLAILMSLTSCHSARRKIANSSHLINVQKLANAEVSDAKKIVRKLSSNRFFSMLSGIWHS